MRKPKKDRRWSIVKDLDDLSDEEFSDRLSEFNKKGKISYSFGFILCVIAVVLLIVVLY